MKSLLNTDKYTKKVYNSMNGRNERQWIMYGDNTFEPVRRDQSMKNKYISPQGKFDWFVTQEPEDWDPVKEGHKVSLNHDYGQQDKPENTPKPQARNLRLDDKDAQRKTTLGLGSDAYHEYEGRRQAAKAPEEKAKEKTPSQEQGKSTASPVPKGKANNDDSLAYKYIVPPLWKPRGNPDRDWAEGVLRNKLEEWGEGMKNSGHWIQGIIEE